MLSLKTFGGLAVQRPGGAPGGAATQRRRLALLAVLAAAGERGVSRERLVALFWPDSEPERGRAALAQALYALRKDLGVEELVVGTADLRLAPGALASDVATFEAACAAGDHEGAVAAYAGPFLEGVELPELDGFERWRDEERQRLARECARALERLIERDQAAGDRMHAIHWARRLCALEPLSGRAALRLMRALADAGDRSGALAHARVHETLVRAELEVPPDGAVLAYAAELRTALEQAPASPAVAAAPASPLEPVAVAPVPLALPAPSPPATDADRPWWQALDTPYRGVPAARRPVARRLPRLAWAAIGVACGAVLAVAGAMLLLRRPPAAAPAAPRVVAVGRIADLRGDGQGAALPIEEMLAAGLARIPGLQVVSSARMHELARPEQGDSAGAALRAAREAGATELVGGSLVRKPDGTLRLDLTRTDLASGRVASAASVEGTDPFALVERGTTALGGGDAVRPGALASATTGSLVAFRLYEEGLRSWYAGDRAAARRLFDAAIAEDSTFAMARYYAAEAALPDFDEWVRHMRVALALSDRVGDRDRLTIRLAWAGAMEDPAQLALAESLATRWPGEPEPHLQYAGALLRAGRFVAADAEYRRAYEVEPVPYRRSATGRCYGCEAMYGRGDALRIADSLEAAERVLRRWTREDAGNPQAWHRLGDVLMYQGRTAEALAADSTGNVRDSSAADGGIRWLILLYAGRFAEPDRRLAEEVRSGDPAARHHGLWWSAISFRNQGRLREGLAAAQAFRRLAPARKPKDALDVAAQAEGAARLDLGEYRTAAAIFDSVSRLDLGNVPASRRARHRAWSLTLAATALALAGDTTSLAWRADTIEALGRLSAFGRDQRLHHHVRGLLFQARGRHEEAVEAFRRSLFAPTSFPRTSLALARSLSALGRDREAVAALQPLFHAPLESGGLYSTYAEAHEAIAATFDRLGSTDSARVHYLEVARRWSQADPVLQPRRAAAVAWLDRHGGLAGSASSE